MVWFHVHLVLVTDSFLKQGISVPATLLSCRKNSLPWKDMITVADWYDISGPSIQNNDSSIDALKQMSKVIQRYTMWLPRIGRVWVGLKDFEWSIIIENCPNLKETRIGLGNLVHSELSVYTAWSFEDLL